MRVCVIDGRGGGLGSRLVAGLRKTLVRDCQIMALGTNDAAAEAMREAGAEPVASGADAISRLVPTVDVIVASLNLVLPGAMLGEVTPEIVSTILEAKAKKVLLPLNRVRVEVVGSEDHTLETLIARSLLSVTRFVSASRPSWPRRFPIRVVAGPRGSVPADESAVGGPSWASHPSTAFMTRSRGYDTRTDVHGRCGDSMQCVGNGPGPRPGRT